MQISPSTLRAVADQPLKSVHAQKNPSTHSVANQHLRVHDIINPLKLNVPLIMPDSALGGGSLPGTAFTAPSNVKGCQRVPRDRGALPHPHPHESRGQESPRGFLTRGRFCPSSPFSTAPTAIAMAADGYVAAANRSSGNRANGSCSELAAEQMDLACSSKADASSSSKQMDLALAVVE
ncbi:hypothetical protein SLEP1_g58148 [Rubroshorea leprosula]|uniref:Uncharacterized protein n=1 Tax=Rubroshorea leprosula TaxID=152421 RepID=A0AAV5MND8_9ROSI|nr:hypothetical protein SLEP1_g58148 [Rubroshorea leprosula]